MSMVLQGATLVDGTGADPLEAATLAIGDDGRIAAADTDGDTLDLSGLTVLPGLIDAHVHLTVASDIAASMRRDVSVAQAAADIFDVCSRALDAGFTTVRDVGGADAGLVEAIANGSVRGPRVLAAGPLLCQTGGHGHFAPAWEASDLWHQHHVPGLTGLSLLADGEEGMRRAAREAFRRGATFLKLCVTGGVISTHDKLTDTQFSVGEIRVAVQEAAARGTYVTVHAHNNEGIRNAIEAGVKCVEHGTQIDAETAQLMVERGVSYVPTLTVVETLVEQGTTIGLPEAIVARAAGTREQMAAATRAAYDAGVRVGSGSDLIGPRQANRGLELVLKSEILGSMAALVSATKLNAEILGVADELGTLETGKHADLIAVDGNPLENVRLLENVGFVMKGGKVYKQP